MSDPDPEFEALLDKMAEEMALEEDDHPVDRHLWGVARRTEFSCDDSKYQCSKCQALLTVRTDQSIAEAMKEQGVIANCAEQLIKDVAAF